MPYKIEILCEPDEQCKNQYFWWCILQFNNKTFDWNNSGNCGWEHSMKQAFETAYQNYLEIKREEDHEI